jgi:hypothetical protein
MCSWGKGWNFIQSASRGIDPASRCKAVLITISHVVLGGPQEASIIERVRGQAGPGRANLGYPGLNSPRPTRKPAVELPRQQSPGPPVMVHGLDPWLAPWRPGPAKMPCLHEGPIWQRMNDEVHGRMIIGWIPMNRWMKLYPVTGLDWWLQKKRWGYRELNGGALGVGCMKLDRQVGKDGWNCTMVTGRDWWLQETAHTYTTVVTQASGRLPPISNIFLVCL